MSNTGWGGILKNFHKKGTISNQDFEMESSTGQSLIKFASVTDVNYDPGPNHGAILFQSTNSSPGEALPLFPNLNNFPIPGETVIILDATSIRNGGLQNNYPNLLNNDAFFYISSLSIWNNPSLNSTNNPPFYFNTDSNFIQSARLQSFPGDIILQGRYGNSIRFGNSSTQFNSNNWSDGGTNGDPITIISNGYNSSNENIETDLSSLYLTSYQKIANYKIANDRFNSYNTEDKPITPSEYSFPQIILNSNRIILNAKEDNILISGEKSVGISSNKSVNIDSDKVYINSIDVRIGSIEANQPALLGNDTVDELVKLTKQVKNLAKALSYAQIYPGGVPIPDAPTNQIGTAAVTQCNNILSKLQDDVRGIKSNFVKIR